MSINFTLCCDYVQQMSFMSLSSLHNLQPLFAAPQIPNIRVHEYYSIFIFPSSKFTPDFIWGITFFKTDYSPLLSLHSYFDIIIDGKHCRDINKKIPQLGLLWYWRSSVPWRTLNHWSWTSYGTQKYESSFKKHL